MNTVTLMLSAVEVSTTLAHLRTQYGRLSDIHIDKPTLRSLLVRLETDKVFPLTLPEASVMLRHLRLQHALLDADMMGLEERQVRGGYDGQLSAAWHALDADSVILQDVIRRLWEMIA